MFSCQNKEIIGKGNSRNLWYMVRIITILDIVMIPQKQKFSSSLMENCFISAVANFMELENTNLKFQLIHFSGQMRV